MTMRWSLMGFTAETLRGQRYRVELIEPTESGLYCERGNFHVDPWKPVDRAIITHAHSDHARWGSRSYLCAKSGEGLLRLRLQPDANIQTIAFGETIDINGIRVSLHPAGHLLGSAQVRIEDASTGRVTVVSGDYKTQSDVTCEAFEPVACKGGTFITESTFGLPIYRWAPAHETFDDINNWWRGNAANNVTSIIYAYALGKAQRLIGGVDASIGPIIAHGAILRLIDAYRAAGVKLPEVLPAEPEIVKQHKGRCLVIAPPSAQNNPWLRKFGEQSSAFASGWMHVRGNRRRRNVDRGFALSDHADWSGLLETIRATGARTIGVTHGYADTFARYLREQGYDAYHIRTRFSDAGEEEETPLDAVEGKDHAQGELA
jgi:putative mRNA 3-end processing factor